MGAITGGDLRLVLDFVLDDNADLDDLKDARHAATVLEPAEVKDCLLEMLQKKAQKIRAELD